MTNTVTRDIEEAAAAEGYALVCGVDEAGRGPLAGPVCAAAVILRPDVRIEGLNDSKKLSAQRREALYDDICSGALTYGIAMASAEEIEQMNILEATFLAMNRAIARLMPQPDLALIDGNRNRGISVLSRTVVHGDALSESIAAASILAKVTRDRYMLEMDKLYPGYGFAQHKGYGTAAHYAALDALGPCPIHRPLFLRSWRQGR